MALVGTNQRFYEDQHEQHLKQDLKLKEEHNHNHYQCFKNQKEQQKHRCCSNLMRCQQLIVSWVGADWIFLILLGFLMALCSFVMDSLILILVDAHRWIYDVSRVNVFLQYLTWILYSMVLMCFAAGFTNIVAPQAAGSGIPEMKTGLRGVVLKEYLTFKTLVAKIVSLTCVLGSELPVGKEGPFVHIGSLCAALLCKFMSRFSSIYKNEARNKEMLTAGCAVGIGCCFASPIGGLLFSIEVTSMFFVVRNYWRGIVSATFGSLIYRLLAVWSKEEETITALFTTNFRLDFPFDIQEVPAFVLMGIACGFGGAFFVYLNGQITRFVKRQKAKNNVLISNCFVFSSLVSVLISTLTFPPGFGQFMAGQLTQRDSLFAFFDNRTWTKDGIVEDFDDYLSAWKHPQVNVFILLSIFVCMKFWMSALSITLPIPCGSFVPVFVIGAGLGRLVGEGLATLFPDGINSTDGMYQIVPGAYAVAGAAALTAGVTHTVSTGVIMMELTGQISYSLPILISVILANMIAQSLQPSIYDSIIRIKKLPYLPVLSWGHHERYNVHVEDFMLRDVLYVTPNFTYRDLYNVLCKANLKMLPLVKSADSMLLLGSVERSQLLELLKERLQLLRAREGRMSEPGEVRGQKVSCDVQFQVTTDKMDIPSTKYLKSALRRSSSIVERNSHGDKNSCFSIQNICCSQTDNLMDDEDEQAERILQEKWEEQQLNEQVDFNIVKIDPAPFQLVEQTSLHKTHTMFSVLGLDYAYVTSVGRLIGVVSLKELRKAIESSTSLGVKLRPALAGFRDRGVRATGGDTTELQRLLEQHHDATPS